MLLGFIIGCIHVVLTAYRYAHNGGGGVGRFLESTLFVKYGNDEHFLFELPIKYGSDCQSLGFDIKKKNEIEFRTSLKLSNTFLSFRQ